LLKRTIIICTFAEMSRRIFDFLFFFLNFLSSFGFRFFFYEDLF